jgi:hypothetical protein
MAATSTGPPRALCDAPKSVPQFCAVPDARPVRNESLERRVEKSTHRLRVWSQEGHTYERRIERDGSIRPARQGEGDGHIGWQSAPVSSNTNSGAADTAHFLPPYAMPFICSAARILPHPARVRIVFQPLHCLLILEGYALSNASYISALCQDGEGCGN